jgi:hypothetical protein
MTASVRLPAAASGRDVAQVVDDEDRGDEASDRDSRHDEQRLHGPGLEVGRPDDGDEPEEDEHEHLAEAVVAVRPWAAGYTPGPRRSRAPRRRSSTGPPIATSPSPTTPASPMTIADRDLQLPFGDEAGRGDPDRPGPVGRVGPRAEVRQVVGEVRRDLEQQRDREAAQRRVERGTASRRRGGRPSPTTTPLSAAGQGRRADRERARSERRRRGARARGVEASRVASSGRRGYLR